MSHTVTMTFVVEGAASLSQAAALVELRAKHTPTSGEQYGIHVLKIDKVTSGRPE